jgi:hypothetical protein
MPTQGGANVLDIHAARELLPGQLHAVARIETQNGLNWALLRLAPSTLALSDILAEGGPAGAGYAFFKGRFISGGFVVPALAPTTAPFGGSPHLLIVRASGVRDLALPNVAPLQGETAGAGAPMSATIANNGRVIVGMGVVTMQTGAAGYYAAMVDLGDGAGVADAIDTNFGLDGSAVFRFAPPTAQSQCPGNSAPAQHFANLSSWGNATFLVGNAAPKCYDEANNEFGWSTWLLGARIDNDGGVLFRDSFE